MNLLLGGDIFFFNTENLFLKFGSRRFLCWAFPIRYYLFSDVKTDVIDVTRLYNLHLVDKYVHTYNKTQERTHHLLKKKEHILVSSQWWNDFI